MSENTLTLHARGPVVAVTEQEHNGMAVTVTEEVDLHASFEVDADWIRSEGTVTKNGASLRESDIAEVVVDRMDHADVSYCAGHERHDDWELTLSGRVDDWLTVAVGAAQQVISVGSDDRVATTACHILDDLGDLGSERPLLGMLDLLAQYDVGDYDREAVLADLADAPAPGSDLPAEQEATDD